jgi:hypothetical protein
MAWGKELTKEDLVKAGLNPDDLTELKAKGVTKEELTAMETKITTSVTEALTKSLGELETRLRTPTNKEGEGNNNNNNNNNNNQTEDDTAAFLTDAVGFVNKKVGQSIAFTAINATKMRMDLALDRAKMASPLFKNEALAKEIMDEWGSYKPENFAMNKDFDPDKLLGKIINMVKGSHAEEIQRDTDKREGKYNLVASTSGGGGGGGNGNIGNDNTGKKPEDMLTEIEKAQAARYGMTPKEWADQNAEMAAEEQKVLARA